jgi:WD40 repeat protein
LILLSENSLASGSDSSESCIKIWNIATGECIRTITGHTNSVYSLVKLSGNTILSGSYDTTMKIWNIDNGVCQKTITGHNGGIWSVIKLNE